MPIYYVFKKQIEMIKSFQNFLQIIIIYGDIKKEQELNKMAV